MLAHTDIHSRDEVLSIYQQLNRYANYLIYVTLLVFILGMLTYGQDFSFREHALSHFGRIRTQDGSPNTLSTLIFGTGMLLSSLICFKLSNLAEDNTSHSLLRLAAIGYILLIAPCDILNKIHSMGGALVIGSLWLLTVVLLHDLLRHFSRTKIYLYHLILQGTVLPYAFLYAFGSPLCPLVQKFAIAGLIISLKLAIGENAKECEMILKNTD
ncbi:MAG TPA: hypothetical protein ENH59_00330 [Bacteroidetes bacterium]|nr:hypothetical protein [Bacteroidota bacterium]